jgi:hypothetical protein
VDGLVGLLNGGRKAVIDSGFDDLFGDGCKEDGEVFLDGETEVRNFGNWMRKKKG